jgi:uncharacterized protein (DUF58 family)
MARSDRGWRPTPAHLRALLVASFATLAALVLHRPDLLVLGVPFATIALWAVLTRPRTAPTISAGISLTTVREGEATLWNAHLSRVGGMEEVTTVLEPGAWSQLDPASGVRSEHLEPVETPGGAAGGAGRHTLSTSWRSLRWGRRSVGPGLVGATSSWGAFRFGPVEVEPIAVRTLPMPAVFDTTAPAPHPHGLVGVNRAARPGDGSEFASIRPFQVGDRLKRIHWPVSARTGELHVTSSYADQDSHVVLVVDAFNDLGESEGIEGSASTLDVSVRAAGAVAEHYLHRGERVSLRVLGAADVTRVPPATGQRHLRRVLDTLAAIRPGTDRGDPDERLTQLGIGAGALVVMLSPLVSPVALQQAVALTSRGLTVVVIDSLPDELAVPDVDGYAHLAWRLRMLERSREIRRIEQAGVPVVAWRGPGSLDQVLRELARRAAGPRMAHR